MGSKRECAIGTCSWAALYATGAEAQADAELRAHVDEHTADEWVAELLRLHEQHRATLQLVGQQLGVVVGEVWRIELSDEARTVPAWRFVSRQAALDYIAAEKRTQAPGDTDPRWREPRVFLDRGTVLL